MGFFDDMPEDSEDEIMASLSSCLPDWLMDDSDEVWYTKEGKEIFIKDLTPDHAANIVKMFDGKTPHDIIQRRVDKIKESIGEIHK